MAALEFFTKHGPKTFLTHKGAPCLKKLTHLKPLTDSENRRFDDDFSRRSAKMSALTLETISEGRSRNGNFSQNDSFGLAS
jgi:hypothetical protein